MEIQVEKSDRFLKFMKSISKSPLFDIAEKRIIKIINDPEVGKPMRFGRKGTREVYIKPFRISYYWSKDENLIIFLDIYHKDEQ